MSANRFVQIHTLTSYPGVLLNRDDAGFAKRLPFGGTTRTRVSSQCLKRHWRTFTGEGSIHDLGIPMSVRSRRTFERFVYEPLVDVGVVPELARAATAALMEVSLGESKTAKAKKAKDAEDGTPDDALHTPQVTVLGHPEVSYLLEVGRQVCSEFGEVKEVAAAIKERLGKKEGKKNMEALRAAGAGLDAALFGRMVTSDILARGDAAVHVAHAFTVHAQEVETDYFSALDDLLGRAGEEELGSGHIGTAELTSGLFYGYVVVDVPLLRANLGAHGVLAGDVIGSLVRLVATVSPGAKLGSTAPYAYAQCVMVEAGSAQPRTLANAFQSAISTRGDVLANTYEALTRHCREYDGVYGAPAHRQVIGLGEASALRAAIGAGELTTLRALQEWVSTVSSVEDA